MNERALLVDVCGRPLFQVVHDGGGFSASALSIIFHTDHYEIPDSFEDADSRLIESITA